MTSIVAQKSSYQRFCCSRLWRIHLVHRNLWDSFKVFPRWHRQDWKCHTINMSQALFGYLRHAVQRVPLQPTSEQLYVESIHRRMDPGRNGSLVTRPTHSSSTEEPGVMVSLHTISVWVEIVLRLTLENPGVGCFLWRRLPSYSMIRNTSIL